MSYLLLPADSRLKALAHEIEQERRHALDLAPSGEEEADEEFDEPESRGARAAASRPELERGRARRRDHQRDHDAALPDRRPQPAARKSIAITAPVAARRAPAEPVRESAYAARERLRTERSRWSRNLPPHEQIHREVQARINRETRVRSVTNATIDQLERGNESSAATSGAEPSARSASPSAGDPPGPYRGSLP